MRSRWLIKDIILAVLLCLAAFSQMSLADEPVANNIQGRMKIVCLNVEGGAGDQERFENLVRFVRKENPDVLGLLELVGWDEDDHLKLNEFIKKTDFNDYLFCHANSPFHMAIFTKQKMESKNVLNDKMGHGLLKISLNSAIGDFSILLTHLTPGSEYARLREAKVILKYINKNANMILMGDFNSLALYDPYQVGELMAIFKKQGIRKFGDDEMIRLVIQALLDSGFEDTAVLMKSDFSHTVPTNVNHDQAHAAKLRLDYIFCTKPLAPYLKAYRVIQNDETNILSDHYPVMCEFEFDHRS